MEKTQLGLGESAPRESVDPAIDHTVAQDPSARASAEQIGSARGAAGAPERGDSIGRFVVLGVLGEGGMGVVYSGYDPHLDRKVAIKLLAARATRSADDAKIRLLREAQAMAKINHPNVVKVHEVGTFNDQIYLAMEFANAGTLRIWLEREKRTLERILDVFSQAGGGLAAAHAVGLVHRDFKPDNVLMSKGDVAQVTDFGLVSVANAVVRAPTEQPELERELSSSSPMSQDLTRTGSIMGTPTYMAPEQFSGGQATSQTDQFSFCVALYEALYGMRPFEGANYAELSMNVLLGKAKAAPAKSNVPAAIRRALLRGIATDPAARHPSMAALLDQLSPERRRRKRRIVVAIAAGVVAIAGGAFVALHHTAPACSTGDERIAAVWNANTRDGLLHAFDASHRPNAKPTFEKASPIVDEWTGTWKRGYVEACRATRERGEQSTHLLDLRMECLTRRLDDARIMLDVLASGGGDAVDHALDAVLALPSVAPCADPAGLTAVVAPPDAAVSKSVDAVRTQISAAKAELKLARYKSALVKANQAVEAARTTHYPPVVASALIMLGEVQEGLADPVSGATFTEASRIALAAGDLATAIDATVSRMSTLVIANHYEMAQELGELSDAMISYVRPSAAVINRLGNTTGYLDFKRGRPKEAEARYLATLVIVRRELGTHSPEAVNTLHSLGNLYTEQGRFADARKALQEVLAAREVVAGKDHPSVANALNDLGNLARAEGNLDETKALYERALAIRVAALGPDHPDVASSLNNLGNYYSDKGEPDKAQSYLEQALAVDEKAFGKASVELATPLSNLALVKNQRGDSEGARAEYARALGLLEAAHGPDHPSLAGVLLNLGVVEVDEHHYPQALALYQRAMAISAKAYGPDHPDVADAMANISSVYKQLGRLHDADDMTARTIAVIGKAYGADHPRMGGVLVNYGALQVEEKQYSAALATFQRALAIFEAKLGKDHPYAAFADVGIATALIELKRVPEAMPYAERALAIRAETEASPNDLAEAHFLLARTLGSRPKAIAMAKLALTESQTADNKDQVAEVKAWLRTHR